MRSGLRCAIAVAAVVALLFVLPLPVAPSTAPAPPGGIGPVDGLASASALPTVPEPPGNVTVAPPFVANGGVRAVASVPASEPMTVEVGLALPEPGALAGLASALYVPGTAMYHRFENVSELANAFGPSAPTLAAASSYFERFGLSVVVSPDHLLLTVSGSESQVGAAFDTSFDQYLGPEGRSFVSHPTPAILPTVAPWTGVFGLGNVSPFTPDLEPYLSMAPVDGPAAGCLSVGALVPCQIWSAYNVSSLLADGTDGSGQTVAVVDAYTSNEGESALASDLSTFASDNGLSVGSVNYVYPVPSSADLNSTNSLPGWNYEDALDLEWARASAPGATIDMTFSPNTGVGLYEAIDWLVAHQAADVISLSWGEPDVGVFNAYSGPCSVACNASTDGSYAILAPTLEFAAAEGIGVFAAAGDCGASDGTSGLSTNFPASDPYVTAVGGTSLQVSDSGSYLSESGWSGNSSGAQSPGCVNQGGSGGGYSPFPRPTWQTGLPAGTAGRGVPDVALDAATPVEIVVGGSLLGAEGTSVSTPIWAGIAALANQYAGRSLGLLTPALYAIAAGPKYALDFHDILSGNNGYPAGVGWDPVTGLGSPQVASLVPDLASAPTVSTSDLASYVYASPRFGSAPLAVSFRANATGGTGTYPLEGISFGDGNASFAGASPIHHTFLLAGVYSVQAYAADSDSNYSVSAPVVIVVGGGGSLSVNLSVSDARPAVGAAVSFTVSVSRGRAPYVLNYTFGDGTFVEGTGLLSVEHTYGAAGSFCAAVVASDSATPVDGGASARVAVSVGGAPVPDCRNDTSPLVIHAGPPPAARDAPADFSDLVSGVTATGGSSTESGLAPSLQFRWDDPYANSCGCSILRTPGSYVLTIYANDSEQEQAEATVNVTVASPLVGIFTANRTFGEAPLQVGFLGSAVGGEGASASLTNWSFGDGTSAVGAAVTATYSTPGLYVARAHLSDLGRGNASEAFLIDVVPSGATSLPYLPFLTATISPAVDVPLGESANFTADLQTSNGSSVPSSIHWAFGAGSGAYRSSFNWTYSSPDALSPNGTLEIDLNASFSSPLTSSSGMLANRTTTILLPNFGARESTGFVPHTNALSLSDVGGPTSGIAPLLWNGSAVASGPGSLSVAWTFANGTRAAGDTVRARLSAAAQTVVVTANDSWGDSATDVLSAWVVPPLEVSVTISSVSGASFGTVSFSSNVTGGFGPPYQFHWSFGDGTTGTEANGTHTYAAAGSYHVWLNVTDPRGDTASARANVTAEPPATTTSFPTVALLAAGGAVGLAMGVLAVARRRGPDRGRLSP